MDGSRERQPLIEAEVRPPDEAPAELIRAQRVTRDEQYLHIEIGQWYRVNEKGDDDKNWLGCVTHVGSNYVKLTGISERYNSSYDTRVHLKDFETVCTREWNAEAIIREKIDERRMQVRGLMEKVQRITSALAVAPRRELYDGAGETQALAVYSQAQDIGAYKKSLIKAKEKTLPALFKQIQEVNEAMAEWMKAPLIPLEAEAEALEPVIKTIEGRIFNVELYAGLVEEVKQIADGEPAGMMEPLHLFQRRAYMDEECLAQYKHGGMEFKDVKDFDAWLTGKENIDRLLPFPRCALAFQVRRNEKKREMTNLSDFINFVFNRPQDLDKLTFLYIRNGERVYRLNTKIQFGRQLFPDTERSNLNGTLYAKMWGHSKVEDLIGESEYLGLVDAWKAARKKRADQIREMRRQRIPEKEWFGKIGSDYHTEPRRYHGEYVKWTPESVYYDDIAEYVRKQIDKHNRLVLVMQGLFDRSEVLHPHPPYQLWTPEGFGQAVRLIYDDTRGLVAGAAPDFDAFRERLNASLKEGSITVGQEDVWEEVEAERYNAACRANWRIRDHRDVERHRPYGNPGPGTLARVVKFSKTKGCTYRWERDRVGYNRYGPDTPIPCRLTVPTERLLNVDAYKLGDFKQFFADPRTRADYLQWAPFLLEAEEFHAGNRIEGKDGRIVEKKTKKRKRW